MSQLPEIPNEDCAHGKSTEYVHHLATTSNISGNTIGHTSIFSSSPVVPTLAPYRARELPARAKYVTTKSSAEGPLDADSYHLHQDPAWTDHGWQELQAKKLNPNDEDQILGHSKYILEFKEYLRNYDQFSLDKLLELEPTSLDAGILLGWFYHDWLGVERLHRQWILIIARNLEMLPFAPRKVRDAYWNQKEDSFDSTYGLWTRRLGYDPEQPLRSQIPRQEGNARS